MGRISGNRDMRCTYIWREYDGSVGRPWAPLEEAQQLGKNDGHAPSGI